MAKALPTGKRGAFTTFVLLSSKVRCIYCPVLEVLPHSVDILLLGVLRVFHLVVANATKVEQHAVICRVIGFLYHRPRYYNGLVRENLFEVAEPFQEVGRLVIFHELQDDEARHFGPLGGSLENVVLGLFGEGKGDRLYLLAMLVEAQHEFLGKRRPAGVLELTQLYTLKYQFDNVL